MDPTQTKLFLMMTLVSLLFAAQLADAKRRVRGDADAARPRARCGGRAPSSS